MKGFYEACRLLPEIVIYNKLFGQKGVLVYAKSGDNKLNLNRFFSSIVKHEVYRYTTRTNIRIVTKLVLTFRLHAADFGVRCIGV